MNQFVSRGGIKLQQALDTFNVDVKGLIVLDVGSSTGGFVDCLLQNDAAKVYSLDTAYGELAWKLRNDPRVVVIERQNILYFDSLPEKVDLITIDVTFTSLEKILPAVRKFLKNTGRIIALIKPQYERQDIALKHHGVIPLDMVEQIVNEIDFSGFRILQKADSPILGGSGNKEYLALMKINYEYPLA